jgi:hypothetical protein
MLFIHAQIMTHDLYVCPWINIHRHVSVYIHMYTSSRHASWEMSSLLKHEYTYASPHSDTRHIPKQALEAACYNLTNIISQIQPIQHEPCICALACGLRSVLISKSGQRHRHIYMHIYIYYTHAHTNTHSHTHTHTHTHIHIYARTRRTCM